MIAFPLTVRILSLRAIRRSPKAKPTPWTWTIRAPMMWAGVVLVITAINQTAGGIALLVGMAVLLAFAARMLINAPGVTRRAWQKRSATPTRGGEQRKSRKVLTPSASDNCSGTRSRSGRLVCCSWYSLRRCWASTERHARTVDPRSL